MNNLVKYYYLVITALALSLVTACSAEIGSEAWCAAMQEKPAGDWTANEASDFAKHCIFN
ncbi:MAG: DUF3012 domain-containing protein [Gammaproteobacteria bacterium]|nr:DUF3012 domain-containing protein [Gammaproteobacteria bacterium]